MSYPQEIDQFQNPTATSNTVTVPHATQHANANDAIEALEAKVGITNSAVTTSLDYKISNGSSFNPGHKHSLAAAMNDVNISSVADGEVLIYNAGEGKWKNASTDAPDSSTTVKGVVKLAEAPASATEPIAVGTNDTRFTTLSGGALHGTTNKIVDQAMVTEAKTASKIPIRDANSDVLVATTPTAGDAASSKTYVDTQRDADRWISSSTNTTTAIPAGANWAMVRATDTASGGSSVGLCLSVSAHNTPVTVNALGGAVQAGITATWTSGANLVLTSVSSGTVSGVKVDFYK